MYNRILPTKFYLICYCVLQNFLDVVRNQECPLYPNGNIFVDPRTEAAQAAAEAYFPRPDSCDPDSIFYSADGHCNNLKMPHWGVTARPFVRHLPANYADGISKVRTSVVDGSPLPLTRLIRTEIFPNNENRLIDRNLFFNAFGQFVDHDVSLQTPTPVNATCCQNGKPVQNVNETLCIPLIIPEDDYFYSKDGVTCVGVKRATNTEILGFNVQPVHQINNQTGFLDLSPLYAPNSDRMNELRVFQRGFLKIIFDGKGPTFVTTTGMDKCPFGGFVREPGTDCFLSGDPRVNQNPEMAVADISLLLAHNYIASKLYEINPYFDDELLFQFARRIATACYQNVVMVEYFPTLLGPTVSWLYKLYPTGVGHVDGYNPEINPQNLDSFSAAAGRSSHSNVIGTVPFTSVTGQFRSYSLRDVVFNEGFLREKGTFLQLIKAFTIKAVQAQDKFFTEDMSDMLFSPFFAPYRGDLVAIDMLRGRDFGLQPYNAYREYCGLCRVNTFEDLASIISNPEDIHKLKRLYKSVEDLDLYVVGLLEKPLPDSMVGPTFSCIIGMTFARAKYGDRLFYEFPSAKFSFDQLQFIRSTTMSQLLCWAYPKLKYVPMNAFLSPSYQNPVIPCQELRKVDFSVWAS